MIGRRSGWRCPLACACALAALVPAAAAAEPGVTADDGVARDVDLALDLAGGGDARGVCARLDAAAIGRMARLEIAAVQRDRIWTGRLALSLRCGDRGVELLGGRAGGPVQVTRLIELDAAPEAVRDRFLALALAEAAVLVMDGRVELDPDVQPVLDVAPPSAWIFAEPARSIAERPPRASLPLEAGRIRSSDPPSRSPRPREAGLALIARVTRSPAGRMQGAGVRLARFGLLAVDGLVERGSRAARRGRVMMLAGTAGLSLDVGWTHRRLRLAGGPGARAGWIQLRGVPIDPSATGGSFSGPTAGLFAAASARYAVAEGLELFAGGEAGLGLVGVESAIEPGSDRRVQTNGTWLAMDVGARWGW